MNVYTTDKIRNVVLLGHGGCGKTSLAEALVYLSGLSNRMGTIDAGNTVSDYDKEANQKRWEEYDEWASSPNEVRCIFLGKADTSIDSRIFSDNSPNCSSFNNL